MSARPSIEARRSTQGILDTSTVILLARLADASALPLEPLITAVTLAELSVGPLVTEDERERSARQAHLQQAEADFQALPFDAVALRPDRRSEAATCPKARAATASNGSA